ncbi:MAG: M1 family metallopeptidase [Bacteroidota bacterium]
MRILSLLLSVGSCLFAGMLNAQSTDLNYLTSGGKLHPLQAIMDIRHYTIGLDIDIPAKKINGYTEIDLQLTKSTDTLLFDLVHVLTVKNIKVNEREVSFFQKDDKIFITSREGFKTGKQKVFIGYGGEPPLAVRPPWSGGFTWAKDTNGNPWVVINCQLQGAKIYFPCKDHPSDEPNEGVDLFITVPKELVVAGPGLLQDVRNVGSKQATYHWKTNYTISNYCVVFNIAKYKVVERKYTTINGNTVPMQFYVLEEDTAFAQHVLDLKARDTRILEKYFGEYPWVKEKIGVAEVPNPGMEHQTMITFGGDHFKYQKVGGQDYSDNLFHEYAHEWWANKVTNKDWAHMWIQEGIATYAEALAFRELAGEEAYNEVIAGHLKSIRNKKPVVQGEGITMADTYTGDVYVKGSFFMHTLRYVLGDAVFFPTLKTLATDPAYTYNNFVNTTDVEELFSKRSGKDLKPLFDLYLRTTDLIEIIVAPAGLQKYSVKLINLSMALPMDITTDSGTQKLMIDQKGITVTSKTPPVVDAKGYYLKKVHPPAP